MSAFHIICSACGCEFESDMLETTCPECSGGIYQTGSPGYAFAETVKVPKSVMRSGYCQTRELTSREWFEIFQKAQQERDEARAEVARLREALDFTLSCLKHHHMTKPGISTLVEKAEAKAKGETK